MTVGYNDFHSLQTSWNRRFRDGLQFTLNYTLSRNKGTAGNGVRITRDANNNIVLRDDYAQGNYQITGNDRTHVVKANFVWDLPDLPRSGAVSSIVGAVINDWQLSGIFTGGSGAPYTVGYSYQGGIGAPILTGTPNYNARIIITGDPGKGCSSDLDAAVQHLGLQRPAARQPGPRVGAQLHARVPGQDLRLRDRAEHQHGRQPSAPAARRAVQRLQRGDHQRPERDDEHREPGHGVDGDQPAV